MAEELGTRDVLEQVDARLGNVEQDVRDLRTEIRSGFERVQKSFDDVRSDSATFRSDLDARFESQTRWLVGLVLASWLTLMASIWLKS